MSKASSWSRRTAPAALEAVNGETLRANAGVICSVTPNQLYERLMKDWPTTLPADVKTGVARYRYGKGNMQDPLCSLRSAALEGQCRAWQGRAFSFGAWSRLAFQRGQ